MSSRRLCFWSMELHITAAFASLGCAFIVLKKQLEDLWGVFNSDHGQGALGVRRGRSAQVSRIPKQVTWQS